MIHVFDDVLPNPEAYRAKALSQHFGDVTLGPDTFRGIASPVDGTLESALTILLPDIEPSVTFFRKSPEGQKEPTYIHSDSDMGKWTAVYYMNPDPPEGDGTTFWKQGDATSGEWTPELAKKARSGEGFEPWRSVAARFNRLLVFSADLFHSRTMFQNYGTGNDARLIQVVFAR